VSESSRPVTPPADPGTEPHYYKLGDAARIVGVAPSAIRYWQAEFAAFVRPVRTKTGQHVFSRRDVRALSLIKRMLHEEQRTAREARDRMPTLMAAEDKAIADADAQVAAEQAAAEAPPEPVPVPVEAPRPRKGRGSAAKDALPSPAAPLPLIPLVDDGEAARLADRVKVLESEVRAANDRAEALALERDALRRHCEAIERDRDDERARHATAEVAHAEALMRNEALSRELGVMRRRWNVAIDTAGALLRELSDEAGRR
jgi:DNA-binding transcriptional MerR regulator